MKSSNNPTLPQIKNFRTECLRIGLEFIHDFGYSGVLRWGSGRAAPQNIPREAWTKVIVNMYYICVFVNLWFVYLWICDWCICDLCIYGEMSSCLAAPQTSQGRRGPKSEPRAFKELSQNLWELWKNRECSTFIELPRVSADSKSPHANWGCVLFLISVS